MFLQKAETENPDIVQCNPFSSLSWLLFSTCANGLIMLEYASVSVYFRIHMHTSVHFIYTFYFGGLTFSSYERLSAQALEA